MKLRLITCSMVAMAAAVIGQAQTPVPAQLPAPARPGAALQLRAKRAAAIRGQVAKNLNLSPTQKDQMKTIRQQTKLSVQPVQDQLRQNRVALTVAVKAGNAAQIQNLSKTQGELRGQALTIRSQATAQLYAGLTNDQRTKLDAMQARIQARLAQRQATGAPAR